MSIKDNKKEHQAALNEAHRNFPPAATYPKSPSECVHDFAFTVYCDGTWDIVRCPICGEERVFPCSFDDDYD